VLNNAISPIRPDRIPIHGGQINIEVTITVNEEGYEGAIPIDAVNRILRDYLKEEHADKIAVR
jgi:hypothetical protein